MRNAEEAVESLEGMEAVEGRDNGDRDGDSLADGDPSEPSLTWGRDPDGGSPSLLERDEAGRIRGRWESVQAGFVDDPHRAVEQADVAVDAVVQRISRALADERDRLARSWDRGDEPVTTEDLRQALQRYRAFLERLLTL